MIKCNVSSPYFKGRPHSEKFMKFEFENNELRSIFFRNISARATSKLSNKDIIDRQYIHPIYLLRFPWR